jgi:hypothetical protein
MDFMAKTGLLVHPQFALAASVPDSGPKNLAKKLLNRMNSAFIVGTLSRKKVGKH